MDLFVLRRIAAPWRAVQTPQVFERGLYEQAMQVAAQEGADYTDDCQLVSIWEKWSIWSPAVIQISRLQPRRTSLRRRRSSKKKGAILCELGTATMSTGWCPAGNWFWVVLKSLMIKAFWGIRMPMY